MDAQIRSLGDYKAEIRIRHDVSATAKIKVVRA